MSILDVRLVMAISTKRSPSGRLQIDPKKGSHGDKITIDNVMLDHVEDRNRGKRLTQETIDILNIGAVATETPSSMVYVIDVEGEEAERKVKRAANVKLAKSLIERYNSSVSEDDKIPNFANAISDEDLAVQVIELQNKINK